MTPCRRLLNFLPLTLLASIFLFFLSADTHAIECRNAWWDPSGWGCVMGPSMGIGIFQCDCPDGTTGNAQCNTPTGCNVANCCDQTCNFDDCQPIAAPPPPPPPGCGSGPACNAGQCCTSGGANLPAGTCIAPAAGIPQGYNCDDSCQCASGGDICSRPVRNPQVYPNRCCPPAMMTSPTACFGGDGAPCGSNAECEGGRCCNGGRCGACAPPPPPPPPTVNYYRCGGAGCMLDNVACTAPTATCFANNPTCAGTCVTAPPPPPPPPTPPPPPPPPVSCVGTRCDGATVTSTTLGSTVCAIDLHIWQCTATGYGWTAATCSCGTPPPTPPPPPPPPTGCSAETTYIEANQTSIDFYCRVVFGLASCAIGNYNNLTCHVRTGVSGNPEWAPFGPACTNPYCAVCGCAPTPPPPPPPPAPPTNCAPEFVYLESNQPSIDNYCRLYGLPTCPLGTYDNLTCHGRSGPSGPEWAPFGPACTNPYCTGCACITTPPPPPPPPTGPASALLTVNGSASITVPAGGTVSYLWSSSNTTSGATTLQIFNAGGTSVANDPCGIIAGPFPPITGTSGSIPNAATQACQAGFRYQFTYTASGPGGSQSSIANITVVSTTTTPPPAIPPPPPPPAPDCPNNSICGHVYVAEVVANSPLSNVVVEFRDANGTLVRSGKTLSNGYYELNPNGKSGFVSVAPGRNQSVSPVRKAVTPGFGSDFRVRGVTAKLTIRGNPGTFVLVSTGTWVGNPPAVSAGSNASRAFTGTIGQDGNLNMSVPRGSYYLTCWSSQIVGGKWGYQHVDSQLITTGVTGNIIEPQATGVSVSCNGD